MMKTPLVLALALAATASLGFGAYTEVVHETHPLSSDGTIELQNVNGAIEITAWDKNEVEIEATKSVSKEEKLKILQVKIDAQPTKLVINTEYPRELKNSNASVAYKLHVPARAQLKNIKSVNSSITVDGVRGQLVCETVNGAVKLHGVADSATAKSVNGGVWVEAELLPKNARVTAETVNGGCEFRAPAELEASIDAHTVNGGCHSDLAGNTTRSGRNSLKQTLGSGGAKVSLSAVNGGVKIAQR